MLDEFMNFPVMGASGFIRKEVCKQLSTARHSAIVLDVLVEFLNDKAKKL